MADVYAVFGTLLALGIAFPGMLMAWWLLFPGVVGRAGARAAGDPWRCLGVGLLGAIGLSIPIGVLLALPFGPAKFLGFMLLLLVLTAASLGAAGIAAQMGERLGDRVGGAATGPGAFLRGAVALELAAAFPFIGWFILIPLAILASLGAVLLTLLRRQTRRVDVSAEPAQA